jgi:hypothetical protein
MGKQLDALFGQELVQFIGGVNQEVISKWNTNSPGTRSGTSSGHQRYNLPSFWHPGHLVALDHPYVIEDEDHLLQWYLFSATAWPDFLFLGCA